MREQFKYQLAKTTAETMYLLWEMEFQQQGRDLDAMMRRLKDLSAYSLTHADILDRREGVELLALGMFFGLSSDSRLQTNQQRLRFLASDTFDYQGKAETVTRQIAGRQSNSHSKSVQEVHSPHRLRLL